MFYILSVTSGSTNTLNTTTGSGFPRLFEGLGGSYIYGLYGSLIVTRDGWFTLNDIMPTGGRIATSICNAGTVTVVSIPTSSSNSTSRSMYQNYPEGVGGWTQASSLSTNFKSSDEVGDDFITQPVIKGNAHLGAEARAVRATSAITDIFVTSDTGLPKTGLYAITDLEKDSS